MEESIRNTDTQKVPIQRLIVKKVFTTFLKLFAIVFGVNILLIASLSFSALFFPGNSLMIMVQVLIVLGGGVSFFIYIMRNVIVPSPTASSVTAAQLKEEIKQYFLQTIQGETLYKIEEKENTLHVILDKSMTYNHLTALGKEKAKFVLTLDFNNRRKQMRIRTTEWQVAGHLSIFDPGVSLSYKTGFWISMSTTYTPSFEMQENKPSVQLKKMRINSMDLIAPAAQFAHADGWSIRLG